MLHNQSVNRPFLRRSWLGLLVLALAMLALLAFASGYRFGKDLAHRDIEIDQGPWTASKVAHARSECRRQYGGGGDKAALKDCLNRIPFDGNWLPQNQP